MAAKERPSAIDEVSDRDWQNTPASVQHFVVALVERVTRLEDAVADLRQENARLREQVAASSRNSSLPPSADPPAAPPRPPAKPKGRKRGGQPGHSGHARTLYPSEKCQKVVDHKPQRCAGCGEPLVGEDPAPYRHQVVEVPEITLQIEEHRLHALVCSSCGHRTRAPLPADAEITGYGPRVVALVALLQAVLHASHRKTQAVLDEVFGIEIAVGTLALLRLEVKTAVEDAVHEAARYVVQQEVIGADESSWRQGNADGVNPGRRRAWLWVVVTPLVAVFRIALSRGAEVAREMIGGEFSGVLISDRYGVYAWMLGRWQVCWAHLRRDFQRIAERNGSSGRIGEELLNQERHLFRLWRRVRDGTLDRASFARRVAPIRKRVHDLLEQGASYKPGPKEQSERARTARTCAELLKVEEALWVFVEKEGVEPTNNRSERAIRQAVIWRKISLGTQSCDGSEFVAAMLTVITTLTAQNRRVFDYLTEAIEAARTHRPAPSLLPQKSAAL